MPPGEQFSANTFISNYEHFIKQFLQYPATGQALDRARHTAWDKTINHFRKYNFYSQSIEIKKMIAELENYGDVNISKRIEAMLPDNQQAHDPTFKLDVAKELKRLIDDAPAFLQKDKVLTMLNGIIKKENEQLLLLKELGSHKEFDFFNRNDVWRLVLDYYQQTSRGQYGFENESGYMASMFKAFGNLLRSRYEKLTADTLLRLHDTAVDGVLKSGRTLQEFDALSEELKGKYKNDYFIAKGYRDANLNAINLPTR